LTLSGLILKACMDFPDLPAISYADETISYCTLSHKVATYVEYLASLQLKKHEPLGVFLDNTPELVVAILAAAALAHPYVPIDPTYPEERIQYISEHAEIRYVLTASYLKTDIFTQKIKLLLVDEVIDHPLTSNSKIRQHPAPEDLLLYYLYFRFYRQPERSDATQSRCR